MYSITPYEGKNGPRTILEFGLPPSCSPQVQIFRHHPGRDGHLETLNLKP